MCPDEYIWIRRTQYFHYFQENLTIILLLFSFFNRSRHKNWQRKNLYYKVKKVLGTSPKQAEYYELALTHRSASIHHTKGFAVNNERLEFLGDSILNAIVSDHLFRLFPNENEGFLTQLKSKVVSRVFLNEISCKLGLPRLIHSQTPFENTNIPGNVLEAFIGAVYLDLGYNRAKRFVISSVVRDADLEDMIHTETNYKGKVIDWAQKHHQQYSFETDESGSEDKKFVSFFVVNGERFGRGEGANKKEAEQNAAKEACERIFG